MRCHRMTGSGRRVWISGNAVDREDQLDRASAAAVLRRALELLAPQRRLVWLAVTLLVLYTGTILAGPLLVRYAIDHGIIPGDSGVLHLAVALYALSSICAYVAQRWQVLLVARVGETFLRDLRIRVFEHLQRMSMPFYDREKAGVLVSRMTSDVDSLQELVQMGLLMTVINILLLVLSMVLLAAVSWQLLLVCAIAIPPVVLASVKFQRDSNEAYLDVRDRIGATLSQLQEGIAGVRVVQAFARGPRFVENFGSTNRRLYDAHMRSVWVQAWYVPVIEMAGIGTTALVIAAGGWLVVEGVVTVGTVAFFVLTLSNLFEPINQLSQLFNTLQSSGASLQKLFGLLDTQDDVPDPVEPLELPARGELCLAGVGFAYVDGPPVLADVGLCVAPGERLALVGPTGAGKSTLAKLAARMYDPTEGRVTYGGVDLRDCDRASLRGRIVVVPQEGFLFNASVLDNVRIARGDATDDEVREALRAIGVLERFDALTDGLYTQVDERGSRLSAGEKQLVSLARAALVDPEVLVLDEATSSLDPGTELIVERAMDVLMEGRTVIVIAHRLSTAARADRVGVVDAGGLVELGAHDELLAAGGRYAGLFAAWSGTAGRPEVEAAPKG